jgi:hypothetical protein
MRTGPIINVILMVPALVFSGLTTVNSSLQAPAEPRCVVQGRIEILNSRIKLHGGATDESGVAVWLAPPKGALKPEDLRLPRRKIEQIEKRFVPHVMVVQAGTEIDFPNRDPFFHNVFSVYDGKPFDLGLYASGESRPARFDRPGVSFIFCNIHPQMSAVVVTVETPYFAVSARDGSYVIRNVPLGNYGLHLWHERSNEQQLAVQRRVVSLESIVTDLGVIRLDEAGYIPRAHKNKHGEDYENERNLPPYRRP